MTTAMVQHRARGRSAWLLRDAGGRSHLVRTAAAGLVLGVLAGVGCALLAPGSREVVTGVGDLPASPQDEVRVAAEVWFTIVLSAVAVLTTVLWWRPGRRRRVTARHAAPAHRPARARRATQTAGGTAGAVARPHAPAGPTDDPVEAARGPVGLGIATAGAFVQTAAAMLVWYPTVALRDFAAPGELGEERIAAPILSTTSALWVATICATLTYVVLAIVAPTSSLRSRPPVHGHADRAPVPLPAAGSQPDYR